MDRQVKKSKCCNQPQIVLRIWLPNKTETIELKKEINRDQIIDSLKSAKEELCKNLEGELAQYHAEVESLQD